MENPRTRTVALKFSWVSFLKPNRLPLKNSFHVLKILDSLLDRYLYQLPPVSAFQYWDKHVKCRTCSNKVTCKIWVNWIPDNWKSTQAWTLERKGQDQSIGKNQPTHRQGSKQLQEPERGWPRGSSQNREWRAWCASVRSEPRVRSQIGQCKPHVEVVWSREPLLPT